MIKINIQKKLNGANGEFTLNANFKIQNGEFVSILGESGEGKTTLLRVIAGLEKAQGVIQKGKEFWLENNRSLPVQKRGIGYVSQDYALFENMSIIGNLNYVSNNIELANELLKNFGLWDLKNRNIKSLSGGQKQRVSIARALVIKPKLLLLDEPLSALDKKRRESLQNHIINYTKEFNSTTIMVTHNTHEAYFMSDKIFLLKDGKIVEQKRDNLLNEQLFIKAKILDFTLDTNKYKAIVLINNSLFKVSLPKEKYPNLQIGDFIELKIS